MKRDYYQTDKDGFYGAYFGNPKQCSKGMIMMLGDRIDDPMVKTEETVCSFCYHIYGCRMCLHWR